MRLLKGSTAIELGLADLVEDIRILSLGVEVLLILN
jgi:hypothetical protein